MAELKRAGIGCPYCGQDLYVDYDICPHCGQDVPESLLLLIREMRTVGTQGTSSSNNVSLTHYEDLEDDSKTKIGTFERLYEEYQSKPKKYGFDDTDYAPLVNLLSSVLELELSYAIYDKFYQYWQTLANSNNKIELPENREDCTMGTMKFLLNKAKEDKGNNIPQSNLKNWNFAKEKFLNPLEENLEKFVNFRNKAAHKDTISELDFNSFYDTYKPFYSDYMPAILELKKRGDSPGYRMFMDMRKEFPDF